MDWKRQSGRDIQQLIFRTTMSRIHITFVGGQPIPVYQGITATNPNKIIFIYSKQSEDILHRIKKAIEQTFNQQKMPSVETISLSPTDPHMIQEIATKLSAAHANDDISLNITSGPKSWTYLFGIQFCKQNNTTIFYIDQNNILWNYSSMEEEKTLFPDMKTLFYLQGTLPPTQYIDFKDFAPEDSRVVMQITELIHVNTNNFFRLVALARNQTGTTEFSLPNKSFLRWNKTEKSFDIQITSAREDLRHTLKSPHVRQLLLKAGADEAYVMPSAGNPMVFAQKAIDPHAPTVLVYAHYDVMPAEPLELWNSAPFEPEVREGRIWARGADDDKGQSFIQVKAFEYLVKHKLLTHNVKFIFEGEEEIGSPSLEAFCQAHKDLLKADVILVSDTSMLGADLPSLTTGLRGLAYWEIEVTGPNRDLHSGHFGGAVANPINVLCNLISQVTDENGRITIPGFYDEVEEVPQAEREMIAHIPFDEEKYKRSIGVKELFGERGYSTLERNSCRPSFDVCGIWGGYTGEGAKTVLPSKAYAKVSCRLVPHQNHQKISKLFVDYVESITPPTVQVRVTPLHGGQGYVCPITLPAYQAAEKGFTKAFGKKPLAVRRGGSIPIIATFEQVLGIKTVLMGFGLESNAIHSPNENMPLDILRKGIEAVVEFHLNYSSTL